MVQVLCRNVKNHESSASSWIWRIYFPPEVKGKKLRLVGFIWIRLWACLCSSPEKRCPLGASEGSAWEEIKFYECWRLAAVAVFTWTGMGVGQRKISMIESSDSQKITARPAPPPTEKETVNAFWSLGSPSLTSHPGAAAQFTFQLWEERGNLR